METYSLLLTVPVLADVRRRVRVAYHQLKHVNRALRFALQLFELSCQLALLFSWPAIILCYVPIVTTDLVLHYLLALIIRFCPAVMWPASDVYETVTGFVLSLTIGRVVVFFLLLIAYFLYFVFECCRAAVNFVLFFITREEPDAEVLAPAKSPPLQPQPPRARLQPGQPSHTAAVAVASTHHRAARSTAGPSPRRRSGRHTVGFSARRGPRSAAARVSGSSSSSKTSADGGAGGPAAAVRRSVVYRLRRRSSQTPAPAPATAPSARAGAADAEESQPAPLEWTRSVTAAEATTPVPSETCSETGTDSVAESQLDVTDAQRIVVSAVLDPPPQQDLETSITSSKDEKWYDALSSELAEGTFKPQENSWSESADQTVAGARDTKAASPGRGAGNLSVAIPRLEEPQSPVRLQTQAQASTSDGAAGTVGRLSATAPRPGGVRRHSLIPRLSTLHSPTRGGGSCND